VEQLVIPDIVLRVNRCRCSVKLVEEANFEFAGVDVDGNIVFGGLKRELGGKDIKGSNASIPRRQGCLVFL
jgi:hypothetical protein